MWLESLSPRFQGEALKLPAAPGLALAIRAKERAPSADPDAPDRRPAGQAGLPLPAVDLVKRLEIAQARRRGPCNPGSTSPSGDGPSENGPRRPPQRPEHRVAEGGGRGQRMDPRPEEDLVGVDVADAGDDPLVEEEALDAPLPAAKAPGERGPESISRGSGPSAVELRGGTRRTRPETAQEAEFPDVAEPELQSAAGERDDEPGMLVRRGRRARSGGAGPSSSDGRRASIPPRRR